MSEKYDHDWRCPNCGCHSYSLVDERDERTGKFAPGEGKRCHNCKDIDYPPHHMLSDAYYAFCLQDRQR